MSDFHNLLRELDDGEAEYSAATILRGGEKIERPYLTLLASIPPSELAKYAQPGSKLWTDGYLARFHLVMPPKLNPGDDLIPNEAREIPEELWRPLREWHNRLGTPEIKLIKETDAKDKETGRYRVRRGEYPEKECRLADGVYKAWGNYTKAMRMLVLKSANHDLDGCYSRFPAKALRIAMLLASLENDGLIEMRHWAWAQAYCERLRQNLHYTYAQLTKDAPTQENKDEEKVLKYIRVFQGKGAIPTARELAQAMHLKTLAVKSILQGLEEDNVVEKVILNEAKQSIGYLIVTTAA